jgi:hypothetical protein
MDNMFKQCPPLMHDKRFITTYDSTSTVTQKIRKLNNIQSTHDFRNFLQNNAQTIINNERNYHAKNNSCVVNNHCSNGFAQLK